MLATEQDAKTYWWCPFSQVRYFGNPKFAAAAATPNRIKPATRWLRWKNGLYRTFFPRLHYLNRAKFFRCYGSGCAAWRWENGLKQRGYCGLSGRPHEDIP